MYNVSIADLQTRLGQLTTNMLKLYKKIGEYDATNVSSLTRRLHGVESFAKQSVEAMNKSCSSESAALRTMLQDLQTKFDDR